MPIRTTRDLKKYLSERKLSPEAFARDTKISNMTIRRMLQRPTRWKLPEKYHLTLDHQGTSGIELPMFSLAGDFKVLMKDLEKSGREIKNVEDLSRKVERKVSKAKIGKNFVSHVKFLMQAITQKLPAKSKALAMGALVYFVNPFDLIPDALVGVGYLDDFAVLALVCSYLAKNVKHLAA
jgi:uncharacterized membrane protein YkvA (DUF1232 family)